METAIKTINVLFVLFKADFIQSSPEMCLDTFFRRGRFTKGPSIKDVRILGEGGG